MLFEIVIFLFEISVNEILMINIMILSYIEIIIRDIMIILIYMEIIFIDKFMILIFNEIIIIDKMIKLSFI